MRSKVAWIVVHCNKAKVNAVLSTVFPIQKSKGGFQFVVNYACPHVPAFEPMDLYSQNLVRINSGEHCDPELANFRFPVIITWWKRERGVWGAKLVPAIYKA